MRAPATDLKAVLEDLVLQSEEDWRLRGEAADIYRELIPRFSHQGLADEALGNRYSAQEAEHHRDEQHP